ncbi:MAG: hypothetical protein J2O49_09310 [Sciscionella sp.]|nr:hypothetical protein [Sciscionella sp.]
MTEHRMPIGAVLRDIRWRLVPGERAAPADDTSTARRDNAGAVPLAELTLSTVDGSSMWLGGLVEPRYTRNQQIGATVTGLADGLVTFTCESGLRFTVQTGDPSLCSELDVEHRGYDFPPGGLGVFARTHPETARLYWSSGRPSLAFVDEPSGLALMRGIPMGYTTLQTLQKVAVATGEHLRVWAHENADSSKGAANGYSIVLPPNRAGDYLWLAVGTFGPTCGIARELARRTGEPAAIVRTLRSEPWH